MENMAYVSSPILSSSSYVSLCHVHRCYHYYTLGPPRLVEPSVGLPTPRLQQRTSMGHMCMLDFPKVEEEAWFKLGMPLGNYVLQIFECVLLPPIIF
jgi:hypothetical protein